MVQVRGRDVTQRAVRISRRPAERCLLVPVDVGKYEAMTLVADSTDERRVAPLTFTSHRPRSAQFVRQIDRRPAEAAYVSMGPNTNRSHRGPTDPATSSSATPHGGPDARAPQRTLTRPTAS